MNMGIRKRGKSYQFLFQTNGQRFSKTIREYELDQSIPVQKQLDLLWAEFQVECCKGLYTNTNYTFEEVTEIWLREVAEPNDSPISVKAYKRCLSTRILPFFGKIPVKQINTMMVNKFVNQLKASKTMYTNRENKPVSKGTIHKNFEVLRTILSYCYNNDMIPFNPCSKVKLGLNKAMLEQDNESIHYYSENDFKRVLVLLERCEPEKRLAVEMALKCGLRRSEQWALTWNDIDLVNKTISINKTRQKVQGKMVVLPCKTMSSIRTISMPESLTKLLKEWKIKNGNKMYIFQDLDYDNCTAWFRKWSKANGLPRIKWHDLRHTHATLLLFQGVNIKVISERLGHSNIGTTMNTYTHVTKELDQSASLSIDAL